MKVSDLKTALKRYGFDDTDPLLLWLNSAYHEIENAYEKWSFLEVSEAVVSGANGILTVPGTIRRVSRVREVGTEAASGGSGRDLEYTERRDFLRTVDNTIRTGTPECFTINGTNQIKVWPTPPVGTSFNVVYIKALPDLALDAEEPLIPAQNHYTIVRGAAYVALQAENEEERAASAQAQFESDLEKMIINDSIRHIGEPTFVLDTAEYGD